MLDSLGSADCIYSRAFATIPGGCDANPANKTCILHLWSAFCLDLPEARNGLNASDALEVCVRKLSQGPCVANPSGAACSSGPFAGIQFVDGVGGGGSGSSSSKRQNSNDPLFGNLESNIPLGDQFWKEVIKNVINQAIGAFKFLATPKMEELKITCMGMSHLTSVFEASLGKKIREGCRTVFKTFDTLEASGSVWNDQKGLTTEIGTSEAISLAERTIAALSSTAGITAEETKLITNMSEGFARWYVEGRSVSANVDERSSLLLEATSNQPDWVKIVSATTKLYELSSPETLALRRSPQEVAMLKNLEAGTISKGTPGIYEVSDLVVNINRGRTEDRDLIRKVVATTLNLGDGMFTTTKDYLLMINSKSDENRGKFKLIGRQELNGGEVAKAAGKPGPYGIYYLEEIEAPASTSKATLADLRKELIDEGVSLPGTSAKRVVDALNVPPQTCRRALHPVRNSAHG